MTLSRCRRMYEDAMRAGAAHLLRTSAPSQFKYFADMHGEEVIDQMHHLACFLGGMYALGAYPLFLPYLLPSSSSSLSSSLSSLFSPSLPSLLLLQQIITPFSQYRVTTHRYYNATSDSAEHMELAQELANTCRAFQERQVTGLAPDEVVFESGFDFCASNPHYLLRPGIPSSLLLTLFISSSKFSSFHIIG
jgi:hypothetical protein